MKDVVIGVISSYKFEVIKPWVNSLDNCGFAGHKVMICYDDISDDVIQELTNRNYIIVKPTKPFLINSHMVVVERFYHIWRFLQQECDYRYVISTDVKDVVFQKNPSSWLENYMGGKFINVGCESVCYKYEQWGKDNITKSFGIEIFDFVKDELIFNAGTVAGCAHAIRDFFLNIYICSNASYELFSDQAAMNILLNMSVYKSIVRFTMSEEGWAAQLGITGKQSKCQSIVEPRPILQGDVVCTSKGEPFVLVHQYDRIPEWKNIIAKKYD